MSYSNMLACIPFDDDTEDNNTCSNSEGIFQRRQCVKILKLMDPSVDVQSEPLVKQIKHC